MTCENFLNLHSTPTSRTWPLSRTLSHTAFYIDRVHGSRVDDSDSDLKGGPLHKGPPAHAHNILHPLSDECTAPGPSVVSPLAGRSPVGFGVTRQIPPQFPPPPFPPCIIYRACRRVAIHSAPAMLHSYRGCLCRAARAVITSSRNRLCPAHIDEEFSCGRRICSCQSRRRRSTCQLRGGHGQRGPTGKPPRSSRPRRHWARYWARSS